MCRNIGDFGEITAFHAKSSTQGVSTPVLDFCVEFFKSQTFAIEY